MRVDLSAAGITGVEAEARLRYNIDDPLMCRKCKHGVNMSLTASARQKLGECSATVV